MKLERNKILIVLLALLFWGGGPTQSAAQAASASSASILPMKLVEIQSIRVERTDVIVEVSVSAGIKTVVLESRARLGTGNWEPRSVQRPGEFSTPVKVITFRISRTPEMELLRVRGESVEPLPASFYTGVSSFGVPTTTQVDARVGAVNGTEDKVAAPVATQTDTSSTTRTVVESDIWNIQGDTLYFFNQYRGLQILDVAQPERPVLRGTYQLPAAGEQMYVPETNRVILLARDFCNASGGNGEGQVILLEVKDGQPQLVTQIALPGAIRESRLVGTALYVISERYRTVSVPGKQGAVNEVWEWGSEVTSIDLSQFSRPQVKFKEWAPGYGNAIMATDRYLFVATPQAGASSWNGNSDVRVFDISSPDGTTQALSTIPARGRVKDKFKMNLNGEIFTVVTETAGAILKTQVETFSLANPKDPKPLGTMSIIEREQLYATQFDGHLLYAVTFMRIDPLWIIDLTDPVHPKKVGELEIPGWSTYLRPMGDRVLAVGIDNTNGWRTIVQLFDVQNPAKPALLSKVFLGEQYSSSEANQDEKAFGFLPNDNLILVPFSTWTKDGSFQGIQLIDFDRNGLKKRGTIDHELQARRATMHRGRILSVSGVELLSVDPTDRDRPRVASTTELSWGADRVFAQGPYVIAVESAYGNAPALRVLKSDQTDAALKQIKLSTLPFLGAAVRDQRLYVAQGKSTEVIWPQIWNPTNYFPIATNEANLTLSVFDLTKLPELPLLGQTRSTFPERSWSTLEPLWPKAGLLVWSSQSYWGPWLRGGPISAVDSVGVTARGPASLVADARISILPWWGGGDNRLVAFDVTDASAPKLAAEVSLRGTNNWWSFSQAMASDGLVYLSHQTSEFVKDLKPPPSVSYRWDGAKQVPFTNDPPPGAWVQRYFLDVVNFNDPKNPSVRKPVNIPGSLIGVFHGGALLYTQGYRYGDVMQWTDWKEWLDASAYDGVEAHLVDSLPLPTAWPHPVWAYGANVLLGRPSETKGVNPTIEGWALSDFGKFIRLGATPTRSPANYLRVYGSLLVAQVNDGVELYDASNPAALRNRGFGDPPGCLGYSLDFADGNLESGLWVPLGSYGVTRFPLKP